MPLWFGIVRELRLMTNQRTKPVVLPLSGRWYFRTKGIKRENASAELATRKADQGDAEVWDHQTTKHKSADCHSNEVGKRCESLVCPIFCTNLIVSVAQLSLRSDSCRMGCGEAG